MAKAQDRIVDWTWLREAPEIAAKALGSITFAKTQLRKWLASGDLPWDCVSWQALDAEGIAKTRRDLAQIAVTFPLLAPSGPYRKGDPAFFACERTEIDFENNSAREGTPATVADGAKAEGIKVATERLLALLQVGTVLLPQISVVQQVATKVWFDDIREKHPKQQYERQTAYATRLHVMMQRAPITKVWKYRTVLRRLQDKTGK
jgi:hypothetical protein